MAINPTLPIYDSKGKKVDSFELSKGVFDKELNSAVLYQAVLMYQANKRQGTASTKTRKDVSGGGRKPWRQKGTGRARAGSNRSPLWSGGGVVFGPHPRDFSYSLPKQIKLSALKSSVIDKLTSEDITIVDELKFESNKTKEIATLLKSLKIKEKSLLIFDKEKEKTTDLNRICRNIARLRLSSAQEVTAYDVLQCNKVVITKTALKSLTQRIK
ncbi:50S ribosomal protein L4 [Candidatus Omnitrophota bacterium]